MSPSELAGMMWAAIDVSFLPAAVKQQALAAMAAWPPEAGPA